MFALQRAFWIVHEFKRHGRECVHHILESFIVTSIVDLLTRILALDLQSTVDRLSRRLESREGIQPISLGGGLGDLGFETGEVLSKRAEFAFGLQQETWCGV